ncbi:MAG: sensor histidine kinase, partial [Pseudomonadota bacterium]
MNSIRTQLLFWLIVPLAVIAGFVSLETYFASRKVSDDLNDRTLLAASLTILENVVASNGTLLADATLETLTQNLGDRFFYYVSGPDGAFVTGYSGYPKPPEGTVLRQGEPAFFDAVYRGAPVRVVRMQQDLADRELNGITTITSWQQTTQRSDLAFDLFTRSLARLVLLVLAAGAIVWFAVTMGLRPLTRLQSAIDSRTPYDLTPIKRTMPIELTGIVGSMNELFERVARSKQNRERFIGDAAHQLRNPVAAIKVQAEASLVTGKKDKMEAGLTQIVQVADKSASMINKMLSGATAHALDRDQEAVFDLLPMVEDVTQLSAPAAFDKDQEISFSKSVDTVVEFRGNETLL